MAERRISTRVAVVGESEYRAAMRSINTELKNLQSALDLTESKYKGNENSLEALTAKGKDLNNILAKQKESVAKAEEGLQNAKNAVKSHAEACAELNAKIEENNTALKELKNSSADTTEEENKLKEANEKLNAELKYHEACIKSAEDGVTKWETDLNKANIALNEAQRAVDSNNAAIEAHEKSTRKDTDAVNALAMAMIASELKQAIHEITEALTECVDASVEFESAMTGVAKTTDMSDDELSAMSEEIKNLATQIPITTTELAGIVETAGQLGIEKDNLISFATVMANLGVATNLTSEEAATMLARFANVTGMAPELYENLGSVIVALGNNFATTESEIVTMGQRLAAAGELAGLTEPEIMALATAMSSVGIEAEAGGTAMTQTLTAIEKAVVNGGDNLNKFAEISGMSAEQFASTWENKPIEAIEAFIEGLGKLDEQGESATLVLDEMGLSGVRQSNMLKSLATASGLLSSAVGTANIAWAEKNALMKEASTRYETTESKMTMFKSSVNNLKIAVGDQLTPAIAELADSGTDVVKWATDFVQANEWLAPTITAVATALGVYTTALTGFTTIQKILPLIKAFNSALADNPATMVAIAIVGLATAIATLVAVMPSATKEADELYDTLETCNKTLKNAQTEFADTTDEIEATSKVIDNHISRLEELNKKTSLTKEEQDEYNGIVAMLQELLPNVGIEMDNTTGKLKTTTEELRLGAQAWEQYAQEQAFATILAEQKAALVETQVGLEKARMELEKYHSTATQGTYDCIAAMEAEQAAREELAQAVIDSKGKETEAVTAAREKAEEATNKTFEVMSQLTESEIQAAEAMFELQNSMAEASASIEEQKAQLAETQGMIDSYKGSLDGAVESSQAMAQSASETKETFSTLGEGATEGFQQIPEAANTALSDTKANVESAKPEIVASVTDMGLQAATGYEEQLAGMKDSTTQVLSDVNQTVLGYRSSAYSAGYSVGSGISQGAAVGVRAYAAQVAAEAAAMVRNAINAANQAAQINSPSKLTRKTGQGLDEGMIYGIRDLEDEVVAQMEDTMGKVTAVEVDPPEIPDNTAQILSMINGVSASDDRLISSIDKLAKAKNRPVNVEVTQNVYANDTSYAGQQREAKRNMKQVARELNR